MTSSCATSAGDYGDRGDQGLEVILLLCAYSLLSRTAIELLRGNHEDQNLMAIHGLLNEASPSLECQVVGPHER